jgi:hypothetical protein
MRIMTPRSLYKWAVVKISLVTFEYERFRKAGELPGTEKIYCVIPASKYQVQIKVFSESNVFNTNI